MEFIDQSFVFTTVFSGEELKNIERVGRTCYKSEDKIRSDSSEKFVRMLIEKEHEAMLEFSYLQARVLTNRGITHEIIRHRHFSFAQESTRYVNYNKNGVRFILPENLSLSEQDSFESVCLVAQSEYNNLVGKGVSPQIARDVLPHSLASEINIGGNYREWRHFFKLRTAPNAHPMLRNLATDMCLYLQDHIPVVFDDCINW